MVQRIEHIVLPDSDSDLYLTQAVARLSSSPAAREVARAWLAAYDVAHGGGAHQAQSIGKAEQSFHFDVDVSTRCAAPGHAEGRANPVWYECSTWLGIWTTEDRITWRTTDGDWVAQLERSVNGRHVSLALYKQAVYVRRQDATGFHVPSRPRRAKRPRALARSLPLPLGG